MTSDSTHDPALADYDDWRRIVEQNVGFPSTRAWVEYARSHNFRRVQARLIEVCPDCATRPSVSAWAQYVYYSTLFRMHECHECGLNWVDVRLATEVIQRHFETAYKDDAYFRIQREPIFRHTAREVAACLPQGGAVLDIGGARGDLMSAVLAIRPDAVVTVHDLSQTATDFARQTYGFSTITGGLSELSAHSGVFDVVVLSDVMYYEYELDRFWTMLRRLVKPGGAIVYRGPNKYALIRAWQAFKFGFRSPTVRGMQDHLRFFNPEHVTILRRCYLERRLRRMGFRSVHTVPSPLLGASLGSRWRAAAFRFAIAAHGITGGRLLLTPSLLVIGRGLER